MDPRAAGAAAASGISGPPVVEVEGLVAGYGERVVLNGVSLKVFEGEVVVIMGGSGSGKSTLLRQLLALEASRAGCVRLLGEDLGRAGAPRLQELRKAMGVAFQSGALFSSLTVGENILLPLDEHTRLAPHTKRIMMRLKLEMVGLPGCEDLMPAELSGGMLKRAALARAVIMDPKLLFCDEPSAGLDPAVAAAIDDAILMLRDAMGMTVVVVTHELESAFNIADRIVVLDNGHILTQGTTKDVRASDSKRVQNLLNRRVEQEPADPNAYLRRLVGET